MKSLSPFLAGAFLVFLAVPSVARVEADDRAVILRLQNQNKVLVERINGLTNDLADSRSEQVGLHKQILDLTRKVNLLAGQVKTLNNKAAAQASTSYVTQAQYQSLLTTIREVDQNRKKDQEVILGTLKKLGSRVGAPSPRASRNAGSSTRQAQVDPSKYKEIYEYTVEPGNNLSAIARAYRQEGIPVTWEDIVDVNPGLIPEKLKVGQVIKIPHPK